MNDTKITLSKNDARKLYWDVFVSNLLFIAIDLFIIINLPWLWLQILFGLCIISVIFHIFQVKKVLIKGKLFPSKKKVKKDDSNKGT